MLAKKKATRMQMLVEFSLRFELVLSLALEVTCGQLLRREVRGDANVSGNPYAAITPILCIARPTRDGIQGLLLHIKSALAGEARISLVRITAAMR